MLNSRCTLNIHVGIQTLISLNVNHHAKPNSNARFSVFASFVNNNIVVSRLNKLGHGIGQFESVVIESSACVNGVFGEGNALTWESLYNVRRITVIGVPERVAVKYGIV